MAWRVIGRAEPQPNCEHPIVLEHEGSGRKLTKRCGATSIVTCLECGKTYRTRVFFVAESGRIQYPGSTVLSLTLTAPSHVDQHCKRHKSCDARRGESCVVCECTPEGGIHIGEWNGDCSARWNRFLEALRRETGLNLQYFRAAELQDRLALHFHVLIRLPKSCGVRISVDQIRRLAMHYGFGHSVDLQAVGSEKAASYLAKYVSKSCGDRSAMPWVDRRTGEITNGNGRYRCWTSSRRWGWTMAQVRAQQQAWVIEVLRAQAPQAPETGALDSKGLRYASVPLPFLAGGGL